MVRLTPARAGLLLIACVTAAWLALSLGNARELERASELLQGDGPARERARAAQEALERTGRLSPDAADRRLLEGVAYLRLGQLGRARRALEEVVASEPRRGQAWALLVEVTRRSDPERSAQAAERIEALDPQLARNRRPRR